MEIDLTHEVSGPRSDAPHDRYRRRIVTAGALVIGLVVGGVVGSFIGQRSGRSGSVMLARVALAGTNPDVVLQWSLANFGSTAAQVSTVLVNDVPVVISSPTVVSRSITEFSTILRCGDGIPQLRITVTDGDGRSGELGYLVDEGDWARFCG